MRPSTSSGRAGGVLANDTIAFLLGCYRLQTHPGATRQTFPTRAKRGLSCAMTQRSNPAPRFLSASGPAMARCFAGIMIPARKVTHHAWRVVVRARALLRVESIYTLVFQEFACGLRHFRQVGRYGMECNTGALSGRSASTSRRRSPAASPRLCGRLYARCRGGPNLALTTPIHSVLCQGEFEP